MLFINAEKLKKYAELNDQMQLMDEAEELEQQATQMQMEQQMAPETRKAMRSSNYVIYNQQRTLPPVDEEVED